MTIRKWFYLFWTSTLIAVISSVGIGLLLQLSDQEFNNVSISQLAYSIMFMILGGAMIGVLSQMGFFAYLILRYIAEGLFQKKIIWTYIQIIAILVVLFDAVYFRRTSVDQTDSIASYLNYSIMPLCILIFSLAVTYWKVKLTNKSAIVPTLFFLVVVTILESVPAIRLNNSASSLFMLVPLFATNTWQILILPKVLNINNKKV
jgi:KinB signaling pathway activation protein